MPPLSDLGVRTRCFARREQLWFGLVQDVIPEAHIADNLELNNKHNRTQQFPFSTKLREQCAALNQAQ